MSFSFSVSRFTPSEVQELMTFLNDSEAEEITAAVHFAEMARERPDSTWGGLQKIGGGETGQMGEREISSAQMVYECEATMYRLLAIAELRRKESLDGLSSLSSN